MYSAASLAAGAASGTAGRTAARLGSKQDDRQHQPAARVELGRDIRRGQGVRQRGYTQLRKEDVDRRFPGLLDSVINADDPALV